jgi:hypothetical protein
LTDGAPRGTLDPVREKGPVGASNTDEAKKEVDASDPFPRKLYHALPIGNPPVRAPVGSTDGLLPELARFLDWLADEAFEEWVKSCE